MGLTSSQQLSAAELTAHQEATGLSTEQLDQLHMRFKALDRRQLGYLTPTELLRIPQLQQNPLHRQIIDGFFAPRERCMNGQRDRATVDRIDFGHFVRTCAIFLVPQFDHVPHQRLDGRAQKLRLLSQMFDTQRCGHIERSDFRKAMKCLLDSVPPSDGVANVHPQSSETELQQLEELAFGTRQSISYELFEERLSTANVADRLKVHKWLEEEQEQQDEPGT